MPAYEVEKWYEREAENEQFKWWRAYYNIEPFGPWRDNLHAGLIAQAIYAANPNGPADINATKFILPIRRVKADLPTDPIEKAFYMLTLRMGGKVTHEHDS